MNKKIRNWLLFIPGVLLATELTVRTVGMVDFPLYEANSGIGYIPAANQKGSFLNKNDWEFNALHMGAPAFQPNSQSDILLIGDSLVYGGNHYRKQERLGPTLQTLTQTSPGNAQVWPIGAGSWALRNELSWLRQNPEVLAKVKQVVFVLNSGDFGAASSWSCERSHPRTRATSAVVYLFNKYVYTFEKCGDVPAALKVPDGDLTTELEAYMAIQGKKTIFILYPDKPEEANHALEASNFEAGTAILKTAGAVSVIHVAHDSRWSNRWYRDGIHPTPEGNRILAKIIFDHLAPY